jgi:hypothetical protein
MQPRGTRQVRLTIMAWQRVLDAVNFTFNTHLQIWVLPSQTWKGNLGRQRVPLKALLIPAC